MKLGDIGKALSCEIVGDPEIEIRGVAGMETAQADELTFLSNRKYKKFLSTTPAAAIIINDASDVPDGKSGLVNADPYLTFARALELFYKPVKLPVGIDKTAVISESALIGKNVTIGAYSYIGDKARIADNVVIMSHCAVYPEVEIGEGTFIHSHCIIRERCKIGSKVILQNNVVIGTDGFGYAKNSNKPNLVDKNEPLWYKIPQTGIVTIDDNVEIGAGSIIDRATIGATTVGKGTKIDNLVQIGHGSNIGQDTLLCAQVGLAGSTNVGNEVILSGQVGAAGHLTIGDRVIATAQTGIPSSVEPGTIISGYPAINNRDWLKSSVVFSQLPQIVKEIRALKAKLEKLEEKEKE